MSYVSNEQVRLHLVDNHPVADAVYNQPVVFDGSDWIRIFGGGIEPSSVVVKGIRSRALTRTTVTMSATPQSIGAAHPAPGSIVVASDSSLGTVYAENVDYTVNYNRGEIVIRIGGCLSDGQTVTLWYSAFEPYERDTDYQLDSASGAVRRVGSGRIADGESALVDYRPVHVNFSDAIVGTAVSEANAVIERLVDPQREFGADPSLSLAALYRALAVVCRTAASRSLSGGNGGDRTATAWLKLADDYATRSDSYLNDFRPAPAGMHPPVRS